ncbi:DUF6545 domain-containing protein [Nocardia brasiliensis]|uniref:DUF6545 domain-containing protein n=1 Tax=Nocardia brasiliensis TaxID=37326 RepID=UPI0004A773DD|nr:DUF6545 domain-containing protein [Nocardia brasiliensis]
MLHSSWPTALSAPIVGCALALAAVRALVFRATLLERQGTLVLAGLACSAALRELTWQRWLTTASGGRLSAALLFQLTICVLVFVAALTIVTLGAVLGERHPLPALLGFASVCCGIGLAFGSRARAAGLLIEQDVGWHATGFWLSLCPLIFWMDTLLVRIGLAELRASTDRRGLVVPAMTLGVVGLHVLGFVWGPLSCAYQLNGIPSVFTRIQIATDRDFALYQLTLFAAVMAIPVVLHARARVGLDYPARCRRRLLPLWSDLTAACPECVYRDPVAPDLGSRFLLHRTVIEIRDCLRILARYDLATPAAPPSSRDPLARYAVQLARACAAKQRGVAPVGATVPLPSSAEDVEGEIAELTQLAKRWGPARKAVAAEAIRGTR